MGISNKDSDKYITLKEASMMTGYSSDYLGQLVRKGKLKGKQVYLNVAWMTTEKDVREYLEKNKRTPAADISFVEELKGRLRRLAVHYSSGDMVVKMARRVLYIFLFVLIFVCVFLGYAVVANIMRISGI